MRDWSNVYESPRPALPTSMYNAAQGEMPLRERWFLDIIPSPWKKKLRSSSSFCPGPSKTRTPPETGRPHLRQHREVLPVVFHDAQCLKSSPRMVQARLSISSTHTCAMKPVWQQSFTWRCCDAEENGLGRSRTRPRLRPPPQDAPDLQDYGASTGPCPAADTGSWWGLLTRGLRVAPLLISQTGAL